MSEPRRLPDIRDIDVAARPRWRRPPSVWALFLVACAAVGVGALVLTARVVWTSRHYDWVRNVETTEGPSAPVAAGLAIACLVIPLSIAAVVVRRDGMGAIPYLAVILPVVTWIVVAASLHVAAVL